MFILLGGCADTRPVVEPASSFDVQALGQGMATGASTIIGQASWVTEKGIKHDAMNETVTLVPSTPYVAECARIVLDATSHCADRLKPYLRSTRTDAEGHFVFGGLHPGTYFLTTRVCWAGGRRRLRPCQAVQGEAVIQRDGQTVEVSL
ncbi:carboxypeptidase-like regulatory domain-containing protein [Dyella sp. GSA-30]|uniref:carboxypeptidase-like regulatory domain-containing protein n=1 Tax=Dyella sp. GSA-30 TaxID=2994496 RepID=UPI002492CC42|nr:carboxypeptidase-like regulatory domain-containing protein [Dyella sp. GSA-30]